MTDTNDASLKTSPLANLHQELGARMVPFTGYNMPVQYEGIIAEHTHTRTQAGLFDVSHMGQAILTGPNVEQALETIVPGDIVDLPEGRVRYTFLTNEQGGILDDFMVTRQKDHLFLIVNAACKETDFAHIAKHLGSSYTLDIKPDLALIALQGPSAVTVLSRYAPEAAQMKFMSATTLVLGGIECGVTRSGYTGEDGYEISVSTNHVERLARRLLEEPEVAPIGLGARDSLRLESGLCLYGNDINTTTTPIEADLKWTISKRRREIGGFPGVDIILNQLATGTCRKRVGLRPSGKAPARAHTEITDATGKVIGEVTSGGFGPSVGGPVAMGYIDTDYS
ncbi:MAG: glycine cleavage system aminomethyltransferase GcvT, partial [Rhodospirillales bacterium]